MVCKGAFVCRLSSSAVLIGLVGMLAACSTAPAELSPKDERSPTAKVATGLQREMEEPLQGYAHRLEMSRFVLGESVNTTSDAFVDFTTGSEGRVTIHRRTQMFSAIPSVTSVERRKSALSRDPAIHNSAVKAYFTQSGLPEMQIDKVAAQAGMSGGGREGDPKALELNFEYYYTNLSRKSAGGIPLPDSFAWARLNVDGNVVAEGVYWPSVDKGVLLAAEALERKLRDPVTRQRFIAKLSPDLAEHAADGAVVIHHTPGVWNGAFEARAVFDVPYNRRMIHLDSEGQRVELVNEGLDALPSAAASR